MRMGTRDTVRASWPAPTGPLQRGRVDQTAVRRPAEKSKVPGALWPALFLAAAWTVAQILAGCGVLPDDLRTSLVFWKNAFGIVFFVACVAACPAALRLSPVALCAGAFPVYAAFRLWARNGFDDPLIVLYGAWWFGFFVVAPTAFRRRSVYRTLIAWIAAAALCAIAVGVVLGVMNDQVYWWDHQRIVFSFTNPIYLGYAGLIVALGGFFLFQRRHRTKTIHRLLMAVGAAVVLGARARNGVLFIVAFGLTYMVISRRQKLVFATLVALIGLGVSVAVIANVSDRLDELSSGRLTLWETVIDENVGELTVSGALFGVGGFQQNMLVSHDTVVADARFARAHSDNAYLDLFVSLGIIGLLLFIIPLLSVCRGLLVAQRRCNKGDPIERDIRVAVATIVGLLAQGIVVSNIPSLGNVMNVLGMSLVMAVWGHACLLPRRTGVRIANPTRVRGRLPSAPRRAWVPAPSA